MEKFWKWVRIVTAALFLLLLGFNLMLTLQLREQQDSLEAQVSQMHLEFYNHSSNMNYVLNTSLNAMQEKIEAGSSLLSDHSISLTYENGRLGVDVHFIPKVVSADEAAYVVLDTGAGEQRTLAQACDTGYIAHILTAPQEVIQATVLFESSAGSRREKLPSLDVMKMFSFYCESKWVNEGYPGEEGGMLSVAVYSTEPTGTPPYLNPRHVQLVVQSDAGEEVGRVDAEENTAQEFAYASGIYAREQTSRRSYVGDLSSFMSLDGHYMVYFELQGENGLIYRAYVADFESENTGFGGWSANGGLVMPDFGEMK